MVATAEKDTQIHMEDIYHWLHLVNHDTHISVISPSPKRFVFMFWMLFSELPINTESFM